MRFIAALAFGNPAEFLAIARAAEAAGWDGLAVSDHVLFPEKIDSAYPYTQDGKPFWEPTVPWPDPWVAIGAMAAVTERLRFLTNVYVLPARNPFLVAKAVATAAVLSGDRVTLGVGVGWMREEFELLGQEFGTRGRRTDEAIEILRALWRGGMVEHHGRHYDFGRVQMSPTPSRPVPIYVGGESAAALRRAARLGEGFISVLHSSAELKEIIGRVNALRKDFGRDREPFDFVCSCNDAFDLEGYRRLADIGVTSVLTMPWVFFGDDPTTLDGKRAGLERFGAEVIAKMG